jgi:hypothetical protein
VSVAVNAGQNATFTVTATGTPAPTYQWRKNGAAITGATSATLSLSNVQDADAGSYDVIVSNSAGSLTSTAAVLTVASSRLANFSALANAGATGDQTLIVGFTIGGTGTKQTLLRTVGPSLAQFGVTNALADPQLRLFDATSTQINANDDWGGTAGLTAAFSATGAFALPPTSKDAALSVPLRAGGYSALINGATAATGAVLIEAYDVDGGTGARLLNLSARNQVGTAGNYLVAGFVIVGTAPKTLLIRGAGPGLTPLGVNGVLADPQLTVYDAKGVVVGQNDNWGGATDLTAAFAKAGAFGFPANSKDAAIVLTLNPGLYTVEVKGVGNATGVALVELYDLQ